MLTAKLTLPAVLALTVFCVAPAADAPHFVCKEGVTVKRTLEMKTKRELTKFTARLGDESRDRDDIHRTMEAQWKMVLRDEVRSCSDGMVTGVARTYATLEKTRSDTLKTKEGDKTSDMPETSELAEKTVVFTRAKDKTWKRTIDDKADDLTADLEADMDYGVLLPDKDAKAGAKWEVDMADAKGALIRPGGDVPFHGKEEPGLMDKRLRKLLWKSTEGKLSLELGSVHDEDGHKLVDITFKGDMSADATTSPEGEEKGPISVHVEDAQKVEGKLVWNLDAGRAQSIAWSSKGSLKLTAELPGKQPDGSDVQIDQIQTFDEEYDYTGAFEVQ